MLINCNQCNVQFNTKPYLVKEGKKNFCSTSCYGKWQRIYNIGRGRIRFEVICDFCGNKLQKCKSEIGKHTFCDRKCLYKWRSITFVGENSPSWKGGHSCYRGYNWDKQRELALERDGHCCIVCKAKDKTLHVHHKIPFRLFNTFESANELLNLITVCNSCHRKLETDFWNNNWDKINAPIPKIRIIKCRQCNQEFAPKSGSAKVCDICCSHICETCGKQFISKKSAFRKIRFCSKHCINTRITKRQSQPILELSLS